MHWDSTNRKLIGITQETTRHDIDQGIEVQIKQRVQADDLILVCEEQSNDDAEETAQEKDEAVTTLSAGLGQISPQLGEGP